MLLRLWLKEYRKLYAAVGRGDRLITERVVTKVTTVPGQEPVKQVVEHTITEETPPLGLRKAFGDVLLLYGLGAAREAGLAGLVDPEAVERGEPTMPPLVYWRTGTAERAEAPPEPTRAERVAERTPRLTAAAMRERVERALQLTQEKLDRYSRSGNIPASPPQEAPDGHRSDRGTVESLD